ncbi:MAG TPA: Trm112 family protein [Kofleriaceae bacterium]|nr:Trm112 family protein [Kofleriaceae bacterium]
MLPPELLAILVCPQSKQPLIYFPHGEGAGAGETAGGGFLLCPASRLRYPVQDGVPVMLVDEATEVDSADLDALLGRARELGLRNLPA